MTAEPTPGTTGSHSVDSLLAGKAFVDLSFWRTVAVTGSDAFGWLNDLVSVDLSDMRPHEARRSLLLSPTGHIRAEFTVALMDGDLLLLQDPTQPDPIDGLLDRYVLSSDVELSDRTDGLALFAFPGRTHAPDEPSTWSKPSAVGAGLDLVVPIEDRDAAATTLEREFTVAGNEDLERWRVLAGVPRFGVDATADDLPSEGGFGDAVSYEKGCYLGQEAVAKVRNLGHPRRALLHVTANEPVSPGDAIVVGGDEVGRITSATDHDGRWWAFAKVRWGAKEGALRTSTGVAITSDDER